MSDTTAVTEAETSEPGLSAAAEQTAEVEAGEQADKPAETQAERIARLEREGDIAADYLEGLLDIADLDGDIDMDVEGDRASVSIVGGKLSHLVGGEGEVLDALQELTRLAVLRETGERSRLMLDIDGHRATRRSELTRIGTEAARKVAESGEPVKLSAMSPFERKVVHDAVAAAGLRSESEGEEPNRCVVVLPALSPSV
ncbi:MAG: single-stranded DNA-binding protein [Catenulispora sp.]|nr:single-stranded DNA-binding protein [Catenulispora sp.]